MAEDVIVLLYKRRDVGLRLAELSDILDYESDLVKNAVLGLVRKKLVVLDVNNRYHINWMNADALKLLKKKGLSVTSAELVALRNKLIKLLKKIHYDRIPLKNVRLRIIKQGDKIFLKPPDYLEKELRDAEDLLIHEGVIRKKRYTERVRQKVL